jgi:hypothetical protein
MVRPLMLSSVRRSKSCTACPLVGMICIAPATSVIWRNLGVKKCPECKSCAKAFGFL